MIERFRWPTRRLSQDEMHLACDYLRSRWGDGPKRVKRAARRAVLRGLKRAPAYERAKRYAIMVAYLEVQATT